MWNNQGGGGGGGYDQQQSSGFGDMGGGYSNTTMGSPGGSQGQKRQRLQNIFPVTLAQVLNCTQQDDKFMMDGIELHQVTTVGMVREVNETQTRLDYKIDDMTGPPVDVKQFVESGDDGEPDVRTVPMRENTYVRIFGHVRSFNNKRSIVAFKLQPITDMNELTNHLLETIYAHMHHTKPQKEGGLPSTAAAAAAGSTVVESGSTGYVGAQPDQGLTSVQSQVYNVIRGCHDEQGVSISFISERVKGPPQKALRDAIEFLSGEGHIYSTIDDEHFKSTDGM